MSCMGSRYIETLLGLRLEPPGVSITAVFETAKECLNNETPFLILREPNGGIIKVKNVIEQRRWLSFEETAVYFGIKKEVAS